MNKIRKTGSGLQNRILADVIVVSLLSIACFLLPFARYAYKKSTYTISGFEFLSGLSILKGKVTVAPATALYVVLAVSVIMLIIGLAISKISARIAGNLMSLAGICQIIATFAFSSGLEKRLDGAKGICSDVGTLLLYLIAALYIAKAFQILYKAKRLSPLDFMVLPGVLYLLINNYLPMIGIFIAFKKIDYSLGIWNSPWVGFDNFKYLFATSDAWLITRNTLLYNLAFIIVGNALGIIVGIFLSEVFSKRLQKFYQTTILLPQLISIIIIAYVVFAFLSNDAGFINNSILGKDNAVNFYATKGYWPLILIVINLWKGLGYSSIIFLSAIVGIDRSLYEAAYIDGAGRFKQITHIILPLLKPTVITLVLIQIGRIFYSDFGLFYQVPMDSGALFSVTQTIDTYVYRGLMQQNNISMASAASAYQSIVGFIIVITVNGIIRKVDRDNALF